MDSSFSLKAEDVHDHLSGTFTGTIFHLQVNTALEPFDFVLKKVANFCKLPLVLFGHYCLLKRIQVKRYICRIQVPDCKSTKPTTGRFDLNLLLLTTDKTNKTLGTALMPHGTYPWSLPFKVDWDALTEEER